MKLKLADTLSLPADEAVAQKYAFVGRSGSGKTYAALKLAELFLTIGAQIVALDWVGIWWSLRLAKNGKAPGFEHVYIFGGEHGDVKLEPTSGALMADLVVDKHISVVLDVMHFRKAERVRFATDFAEQFFHRKKTARSAVHLFIEEAQAYLPQLVKGDVARLVGAFEDIGKVGRNYGIGNSLISQRPQSIHKDVLNQAEVLFAFQTNGPQERKAIAGWTAENTTAGAEMIAELPKLQKGDALVWSPQWLQVSKRVHIEPRETYDASSTPTQRDAQRHVAPKALTEADLASLGESIKATVEKQKADDPRELRRQIAELKKQVAAQQSVAPKQQKVAQKPTLTDADRELLKKLAEQLALRAGDLQHHTAAMVAKATEAFDEVIARLQALGQGHQREFLERLDKAGFQKILGKLSVAGAAALALERPARAELRDGLPPTPRPVQRVRNEAADEVAITPARQKILNGLAFLHGIGVAPADKTQLALIVGVSPTSGGYFNNLGALRSAGLIDYPTGGTVALTAAGQAIASVDGIPSTTTELHAAIRAKLPPAKWKIVEELIRVYPDSVSKDELAARIGVSPTSGGYFNNLGSLRSLGLIFYPRASEAAAQPVLFLDS